MSEKQREKSVLGRKGFFLKVSLWSLFGVLDFLSWYITQRWIPVTQKKRASEGDWELAKTKNKLKRKGEEGHQESMLSHKIQGKESALRRKWWIIEYYVVVK